MKSTDERLVINTAGIWKRFVVIYSCLLVLLTVIVYPIQLSLEDTNIRQFQANEQLKLARVGQLVKRTFLKQLEELNVFAQLPILSVYLDSEESSREFLEGYFQKLTETYQRFEQVSIVNLAGKEMLQINVVAGKAEIERLRIGEDKSNQHYFQVASKLDQGDFFISEPDLIKVLGDIETTEKTIFRFATPIYMISGEKAGILVLNYNAEGLIDSMLETLSNYDGVMSVLLDDSGHAVLNKSSAEAGRDPSNLDIVTVVPNGHDYWSTVQAAEQGAIVVDGALLVYSSIDPIDFDEVQLASGAGSADAFYNGIYGSGYPWHIVSYISETTLHGHLFLYTAVGQVTLLLFILLLGVVTYLAILSRTTSKQIKMHEDVVNNELNYLYEHAPCGYHTIDTWGNVIRINQTELDWLQREREEVINNPLGDLLTEPSKAVFMQYLAKSISFDHAENMELEMQRRDGSTFHATMTAKQFKINNLNTTLIHANVINVNERVKLQQELERQANTDQLTGANNRRHFLEYAKNECQKARNHNQHLSLIMLDIDHFKNINDTYGHAVGDIVLKWFTESVGNLLRPTDLFARLGGEEFVVLFPGATVTNAYEIAERIRQKIMVSSIRIDTGQLINVTVSIGAAELHASESIEVLIKNADMALYESKHNGRNRISCFDQRMAS